MEQREELHTVDRAMGVHRSSLTTPPVRALEGLVDYAVIRRATPQDRTGKVESNQIATDERLSLTTRESDARSDIHRPLESRPLPSQNAATWYFLQVERPRSAHATRC